MGVVAVSQDQLLSLEGSVEEERSPAPSAGSNEVAEFLRDCPLVFGLDDEGLEQVASLCTIVTFHAREQVFAEGEVDSGLWILMSGRVRLYHSDPEGRQLVVGFPAPHTPLDLAALDGRPHTVGATALERCRVLLVPQAARVVIARRFPETIVNTMRQLSRDLRQRDISHAVLSFRSARGRICCTLVQLAEQYGIHQYKRVKINFRLTRQDLADRSGVTLETSIRVLSDLQRRGVVATRSKVIEILDQAELEEWSGCSECELDCTVFAKPTAADMPQVARPVPAGAPRRLVTSLR
ncbi:MAG: Crp/Fnr family transcriptional regulator [Chloroflexi bacterium CFX7]|nr:Crp/Fnr family transcriptional regulator [Chloroflexi bacterium CFX7]RIL04205.1 MAG: hypothetical protein DCC78_01090 [bacterium]